MSMLQLPYGRNIVELDISKLKVLGILKGKEIISDQSESALIQGKLQNLSNYVHARKKVLVIASDITRKVGTERFLPLLLDKLESLGLSKTQIKVIFSTGLHRAQSAEERRFLLGDYFGEIEAVDHNCDGRFVDFGTTSCGTSIRLNPLAEWADNIILTGGINFHYFAGFTGGRKGLLPGIAGRESILQNHRLIFSQTERGFHPQVKPGQIEGNPVAEDLREATDIVAKEKRFYLFNTIINSAGKICRIFCGDYKSEFLAGCEYFKEHNSVLISKQAGLVIASAGGYPYDTNLIQSHKALFHAFQAVQEAGVLILLAECSDGITGKGKTADLKFLDYFNLSLEQMDTRFRQKFDLNCNTAYSIAEKASKGKVILLSSLSPETVIKTGMYPAFDLQDVLKKAFELGGKKIPETYILENASTLLSVLG